MAQGNVDRFKAITRELFEARRGRGYLSDEEESAFAGRLDIQWRGMTDEEQEGVEAWWAKERLVVGG